MIVGHRGAPGYRPEHTSASYELAYRLGVDWVDVDLVATADGELVARHENEIGGTTDVAAHPEFADRRRTKTVDGAERTGFFTEDFTLAELKTLRATERIPDLRPDNTVYDGQYELLTFSEVLDLAERLGAELGHTLGTFPEVKHSAYFTSIGLPIEDELVRILRGRALDHRGAPVVIQSFEPASLRALRERLDVALLQLLPGNPPTAQLSEIAEYAEYIGPEKHMVIGPDNAGNPGAASQLVRDAHAASLRVAPYTFRNENAFLPPSLRSDETGAHWGDAAAEYSLYSSAGVDGLFTDHPDTAVARS